MQSVLVYLQTFCRNSLLKCVLQSKIAKNSLKTPYFGVSRSFEVIDVDNSFKKPINSACYDKQHVLPICNRFQTIRANIGKITSFWKVPLFDALVRGESPYLGAENFRATPCN